MTRWHTTQATHSHLEAVIVQYWNESAPQVRTTPRDSTPLSRPPSDKSAPPPLTQPAAKIAAAFSWRLNTTGNLLDAAGCFIAVSLNDAMVAMIDLHWVDPLSPTPQWENIPTREVEAANDVRVFLDWDGSAYSDPFPMA